MQRLVFKPQILHLITLLGEYLSHAPHNEKNRCMTIGDIHINHQKPSTNYMNIDHKEHHKRTTCMNFESILLNFSCIKYES